MIGALLRCLCHRFHALKNWMVRKIGFLEILHECSLLEEVSWGKEVSAEKLSLSGSFGHAAFSSAPAP